MIVYQLACGQGHYFEGWFASSEACDEQAASGRLQCPTCSTVQVRKLPAAPYVKGSAETAASRVDSGCTQKSIRTVSLSGSGPLAGPSSDSMRTTP